MILSLLILVGGTNKKRPFLKKCAKFQFPVFVIYFQNPLNANIIYSLCIVQKPDLVVFVMDSSIGKAAFDQAQALRHLVIIF